MATTMTDAEVERLVRCFHALADGTRLRVVQMLAGGERCVCELQGLVGAAQSLLSFHLKVLREAGLVSDRKQGRWVYYSLRGSVLEELAGYLREREAGDVARAVGSCCE
jgi:ArsR family transcriptional regulator, arsenate/arsenite/antimonite-responsive transcriptional repressor